MMWDEFEELRKRMRRGFSGSGYSISIQQIGDKTRVDVQGDVSPEQIEQLKREHPKADIFVNGRRVAGKPGIVPIEEEEEKT